MFTALDVGVKVANSADIVRHSLLQSSVNDMILSESYCDHTNNTIASMLLSDSTIISNYTMESINIFDNIQHTLMNEEVDGIKSGLIHIVQNLHHFNTMLEFYSDYHWIARIFLLAIFNFCLFMMGSVIVHIVREESFQPLTFMISYFVLPFFISFVFIVWLVTSLIASGAIMNSGKLLNACAFL